MKNMKIQKQLGIAPIAIILIIIGVLIFGGSGYYAVKKFQKPAVQACTQEAKQCPDGSYVSRTGPNCEFAACPEIQDETKDWKTYRNDKYGFEVKYPGDLARINISSSSSSDNLVIFSAIKKSVNNIGWPERFNIEVNNIPNNFDPLRNGWNFTENAPNGILNYGEFNEDTATFKSEIVNNSYNSIITISYSCLDDNKENICENTHNQILSTFKFIK